MTLALLPRPATSQVWAPFDLVADADAARAEDAAVVIDAEALVRHVDRAAAGAGTRSGRDPCRRRRPGPAARSGRWRRRPSRRGCARRTAARRSCGDIRAAGRVSVWTSMPSATGVTQAGCKRGAAGDLDQAQPAAAVRRQAVEVAQRRDVRCRPRAPPAGWSRPARALTSWPSMVRVLTPCRPS